MTKVVHTKKSAYDVYIGRPSIFGNPFTIGKDGNREEVIIKYKLYFDYEMIKDPSWRKKVLELKGKILGCWCKPLPCHGDVIVEYLERN